VVRPIVIIALLFPGAVEDHISGGDDVLFPVEIKMSLSCSDIEQLKIHPTAGPVCREFGQGHQPVSAAAPHEKRVLSVFKINS
jgi:hypothetical protein